MALLIGLKNNQSSGTFHGVEGLEGFSMSATQFDILKEDQNGELVKFVKNARKEAEKAAKQIDKLEEEQEYCNDERYSEIQNELDKLIQKTRIVKYEKLLIIDGFAV